MSRSTLAFVCAATRRKREMADGSVESRNIGVRESKPRSRRIAGEITGAATTESVFLAERVNLKRE